MTSTGRAWSTSDRPATPLPIQLPYAQYGLFLVLVPLFMVIHFLFTLTSTPFPAWEIALAMVTTSYIWRHVDPDRPARTVIRTALTDWRRSREADRELPEPRIVARRIVVRGSIT